MNLVILKVMSQINLKNQGDSDDMKIKIKILIEK